jgi:hypothetical protein
MLCKIESLTFDSSKHRIQTNTRSKQRNFAISDVKLIQDTKLSAV